MTSVLLGNYADIMNQFGVDSSQAQEFLKVHSENKEFLKLAKLASFLRRKIDLVPTL